MAGPGPGMSHAVHVEPPPTADAPLMPRSTFAGTQSMDPARSSFSVSPVSDGGSVSRDTSHRRWSAEAAVCSLGLGHDTFRKNSGHSGGQASFKQLLRMLQHEHEGALGVMRELQNALAQSRKKLQESYMENNKLAVRMQQLEQSRAGNAAPESDDEDMLLDVTPEHSMRDGRSDDRHRKTTSRDGVASDGLVAVPKRTESRPEQGVLDSTASTAHRSVATMGSAATGSSGQHALRGTGLPGSIDDPHHPVVQDAWQAPETEVRVNENSQTLGGISVGGTVQPILAKEMSPTSVRFNLGRDVTTATCWSRWQESENSELLEGNMMSPTETENKVRFTLRQTFLMYTSIVRRNSANELEDESPEALFSDLPEMVVRKAHKGCSRLLQPLVQQPASTQRTAWEIMGAFLILYDVISIPLRVFDYPETTFTAFMDWLTLLFWTVNVPASFFVGHLDEDSVMIMDPFRIALKYLRTWFLVDMVIILPDWFFTITSTSSSGGGASVRLIRIIRITRAVRLLRLAKMQWILGLIDAKIESEYMTIVVNIVKMILILVGISHFIACGWYAVAERQDGITWLTYEADSFHREDWLYQYATAFHWSITQFTPASMHVQPRTLAERAYAVAIIVFALVGFSYVVGSITQSLTHLRSIKETEKKQFWMLKRYLRVNDIPLTGDNALGLRVQKYAEHAWKRQNVGTPQASVAILDLLSEQLKKELRSAMFLPVMQIHPLFAHLEGKQTVTMHRLAEKAINRKSLACNDKLFFTGETAEGLYFLKDDGRLQYVKPGSKPEQVDIEDWISEQCLWCEDWVHLGSATAVRHSDLIQVGAEKLCDVVKLNPASMQQITVYAKNYMAWLNQQDEDQLSDILQGEDMAPKIHSFIPFQEKDPAQASTTPKSLLNKAKTVQSLMSTFAPRRDSRFGLGLPQGESPPRYDSKGSKGSKNRASPKMRRQGSG